MASLEKRMLENVRRKLDVHARMEKATEFKAEANNHLQQGDARSSLVTYLAGIWFLQRGALPCPAVIVSQSESLDGVVAALGDGDPDDGEVEDERGSAEREEMRIVLHLNLAAAALKLHEWEAARMACEYIFEKLGRAAPAKAWFRLAKAHQGEQRFPESIGLLEHLLESDPRNTDVAKLLKDVRRQQRAAEAKLATPKVENLRQRVEAAGAVARPSVDAGTSVALEQMSGKDFARLSKEQQEALIEEISKGLDAEQESTADEGEVDMAALQKALASAA